MRFWQSNKYIYIFGKRLYYKRLFIRLCNKLNLPIYRNYFTNKNIKKRLHRKLVGEPVNPKWAKRKKNILYKQFGKKCIKCSSIVNLSLDHIIPLSIIGKKANKITNLQILCEKCHEEKTKIENKSLTLKI
jgi:5-methylcytosine-specific restriction endonuclease McrA